MLHLQHGSAYIELNWEERFPFQLCFREKRRQFSISQLYLQLYYKLNMIKTNQVSQY